MGRLTDTLLGKTAYAEKTAAPLIDVSTDGQFGYSQNPAAYVSMTQYVRKPLVVRLLSAPRGFNDLPNPSKWTQTLKSLIETQALRIEGFQGQISLDYQSTPFGGAGEEIETVSDIKRARSQPSWTWRERYNRTIGRFWDQVIFELFGHPETKYPNVCTRVNKPTDLLIDYQCFSVIAFEPDPTFTYATKAWVMVGMGPRQGSVVEGTRDITAPGDGLDISIEFTGVAFQNQAVDDLADVFIKQMAITGANPNNRAMFIKGVEPNIASDAAPHGFAENIAELARAAATP